MKAFADLGYVDGKTATFDHRFPAEQPERFRTMAQELVDAKPNVIVAVTSLAAVMLHRATSSIPIVIVIAPDPVGQGLAQTLAHPGGNVTGLSLMSIDQTGKHLSLLKEAIPGLTRVGILFDVAQPSIDKTVASYRTAAAGMGLSLDTTEAATAGDIEPGLQRLGGSGCGAVIAAPSSLYFNERARLGAAALRSKTPLFVTIGEEVPYGALMSYGQDFPEYFRRAAGYADRILKGARPGDLPIEQPTTLRLVVNQKAARTLGIVFSPTLLAGADEVIE
jgi:putative ABC transport system substrate-binding protein